MPLRGQYARQPRLGQRPDRAGGGGVTLNKYLAAPKAVVPGTTMTYAGLKDETKRADLIAYLTTVK